MTISLIAAMTEDGVIGHDNRIPWHLPDDLRQFKRLTLDHPIVMGRKTWQSLGRPLKQRRNIVVTRDIDFEADGAIVVHDCEAALAAAQPTDEVFIIGGADLYRAFIGRADRFYQTIVHARVMGDVHFPAFDAAAWRLVEEEVHESDDAHPHAFTLRVLERIHEGGGNSAGRQVS